VSTTRGADGSTDSDSGGAIEGGSDGSAEVSSDGATGRGIAAVGDSEEVVSVDGAGCSALSVGMPEADVTNAGGGSRVDDELSRGGREEKDNVKEGGRPGLGGPGGGGGGGGAGCWGGSAGSSDVSGAWASEVSVVSGGGGAVVSGGSTRVVSCSDVVVCSAGGFSGLVLLSSGITGAFGSSSGVAGSVVAGSASDCVGGAFGAAVVLGSLPGGARFGMAVHCFPLMEVMKAPSGRPDMTGRSCVGALYRGNELC
jgi:hypothetical protein